MWAVRAWDPILHGPDAGKFDTEWERYVVRTDSPYMNDLLEYVDQYRDDLYFEGYIEYSTKKTLFVVEWRNSVLSADEFYHASMGNVRECPIVDV